MVLQAVQKRGNSVIAQLPATIKIVAIDLIGHGKTDAPIEVQPYSMEEQVELI